MNCLFNCFSWYLVGSTRLALVLRRIGAVALVAYLPDIYEAFENSKLTLEAVAGLQRLVESDVAAARRVGGQAGQPICIALAEAFGLNLEYSFMDAAGVPQWETYTAKSEAGLSRRIHSPTDNVVLQHTGGNHWVLGKVTRSLPLWDDKSPAEIRSMLVQLSTSAGEVAQNSTFQLLRGIHAATVNFYAKGGYSASPIVRAFEKLNDGSLVVKPGA